MGSTNPESHVDVLIVGAGPAGMMASMWLSEMGVSHRIVDQRGTRTLTGRADGFHVRTVEIWDSFDIYHRIQNYSERFGQWAMWTFNEEGDAGIMRSQRGDIAGLKESRIPAGMMNQGMIEAAFGDGVRARGGPNVERGAKLTGLEIDESKAADLSAFPVKAQVYHALKSELPDTWTGSHTVQEDGSLERERGFIDAYGSDPHEIERHVSGPEATTETIHAKYMIGVDGAHSWIRNQLPDFRMEGDNSDMVFGVLDVIPLTNFPDVRKTCSILSKAGFILLMPRENGLIRLYTQLSEDYSRDPNLKSKDDEAITTAEILRTVQKIMHPYTMEYKYCDWWTVYRVGQRVCNKASYLDRIFLAGDAIHTHSPKGGQGMNVSQQDTYNLAWKVAGVVHGQLSPDILKTYEDERLPVARDLISLDRDMAKILTARANRDEAEAQRVYKRLEYQNGTKLCYGPSLLVAADGEGARQGAATELMLGLRFPNATVYSQADGDPNSSQALLKSNGLWRLLVFAGDVSDASRLAAVNAMGDRLEKLKKQYNTASTRKADFMEILLFHASSIEAVENTDFHDAFFAKDDVFGRNYFTLYADFEAPGDEGKGAHDVYGIDKTKGAMAVVRPDQTVAWVGGLEDVDAMEGWFARFMIEKGDTERRDSGHQNNGTGKKNGV